jgi:hypothetical protein
MQMNWSKNVQERDCHTTNAWRLDFCCRGTAILLGGLDGEWRRVNLPVRNRGNISQKDNKSKLAYGQEKVFRTQVHPADAIVFLEVLAAYSLKFPACCIG